MLIICLSSCGFRPLYGDYGKIEDVAKNLHEIEIESISSIEGTDFYNHMQNLIQNSSGSKYLLKVSLSYSSVPSIIQKNAEILRETESLKTTYRLIEKDSDKVLTSGSFSKISSYSTTFSPYSNSTLKQTTRSDLARVVAEDIRNRLVLFFNSKNKVK